MFAFTLLAVGGFMLCLKLTIVIARWLIKGIVISFMIVFGFTGVMIWLATVVVVDMTMLVLWAMLAIICGLWHKRVPTMKGTKFLFIYPTWS